ncbi:MAG: signal peptidase II [Coriobacteriia bacterium]|nr:signal peptidase II [Coriobacteriia bacterium]
MDLSTSLFWAVLISGVALDRAVKWFEVSGMAVGQSIEAIPQVLNFTYVQNRGVGFGLFEGALWLPILMCVIVFVATAYAFARLRPMPYLVALGLGLLCAGAIGNLIDRIFFGYVVDIFDLTFIRFPVFNVADSMVTIACIILVFWLLSKSGDAVER